MAKTLTLLLVGLAAALTAGCLQKETSHTLYLTPDGSVRWVADELDVRSDEKESGARVAEERNYIGAALTGTHPFAAGLKALGPLTPIETTVLRDQRPFHVVTSAAFARVDRLLERLFTENGLAATVTLTSDGIRSTLRIQLDFTRGIVEHESPANVLLEDFEQFTFVLSEGQFIAGGGFEVRDRSGRARVSGEWLELAERAAEGKRKIELVLAWE